MRTLGQLAARAEARGFDVRLHAEVIDLGVPHVPPACDWCEGPGALNVTVELATVGETDDEAEDLGDVERTLCHTCVERVAPGASVAVARAAAGRAVDVGVQDTLTAVLGPLLRRLGASTELVECASVTVLKAPAPEGITATTT